MPDLATINQLVKDVGKDTALRLMGIFKDDAEKRLAAIAEYLSNGGEVSALRIHAHSLKGLCRTYGAPKGGSAGMELQDACDAGDEAHIRNKAQAALDIIPQEIENVIQALKDLPDA